MLCLDTTTTSDNLGGRGLSNNSTSGSAKIGPHQPGAVPYPISPTRSTVLGQSQPQAPSHAGKPGLGLATGSMVEQSTGELEPDTAAASLG